MEETTRDIAKRESVRQAVIMVFSVATVCVVYTLSDPDAMRAIRMRAALATKRFAQRQADWWQDVADKAATVYNKERP